MPKKADRVRGESVDAADKKPARPAGSAKSEGVGELEADKQRLGDRLHQLSMFGDLAGDSGTMELLESMLSRCLRLFRCKSGSIFLYKPDSDDLELAVAEGPMREALLGIRQGMGTGVAGAVGKRKEGIYVEDIGQSKEFTPRASPRYRTNSFACVPIVYRGELLGVLSLTDKSSGQSFTSADVGRMLAIAGFSSGTIRQSLQQEKLRTFNIELHRRLDVAIERLQSTNQELGRLKNFNESILSSILRGLAAFDDQYCVTYANDPFRAIFPGSAGESGADFRALTIECDGRPWAAVLEAVVNEGKTIHYDGAETPVPEPGVAAPAKRILNLTASPLRDARGAVTGGLVMVEDVTDRVKMERRLSASERHAVIGKLAARVAHELNNPLDGILRFINLSIALKGADDPTREYLTECKKGLERMVGIVSSLLEFSRSTYPTQHDTKLNDVLREAVRVLRHRADSQKVKVTFDLQEGLPDMRCGELIQVFVNLTKNAYDAMKGGGEFRVSSRLGRNEVKVGMSDTGCGIPKEILSRIFDPFFTTKGPGEGTGLGLAICYDIIDKHGGKIAVDSEVGKGTTFTVTLPVS